MRAEHENLGPCPYARVAGIVQWARLKRALGTADSDCMDAAEREVILSRHRDHQRRFETVAVGRQNHAEVIPLRASEPEPTRREIEVLNLISDGLVNREIGKRLFLSEETVKSHVRALLTKLGARSRAHAVAVAFRRGLIS